MDDPPRTRRQLALRRIVEAAFFLALGALWAVVLRLIATLPDSLSIAVLVIVALVCLLILAVT